MKLASIDIGTNTVRLLIAEAAKNKSPDFIIIEREITRLGGSFDGRFLHKDSVARTIDALTKFASVIKENEVSAVRVAATSVVREAEDGDEFVKLVKAKTGLEVEVIDGGREAELMLLGVLSVLKDKPDKVIVFDIGGGSTEYIISESGHVKSSKSINMGVVALTEKYLKSDPPCGEDMKKIDKAVDDFLSSLKKHFSAIDLLDNGNNIKLVGTAGTITTLAALDQKLAKYDVSKVNNYVLTARSVTSLYDRFCSMTFNERARIPCMEKGRADLILAGCVIVKETMKVFGFENMVVCDSGLLEGLLIDLARSKGL